MKKIAAILNQPYPYYTIPAKILRNAAWIFIFVTLFLFLFSPFNINKAEDRYSYIITCLLHSLCATMIYGVFMLLFNKLTHTATREESWKVYKAIVLTGSALFLIGLGSFFLRPFIYNNPDNFSWRYFIEEVLNTFLLGTLLFGIFTLIDAYRLVKANRSGAGIMEQQIEEHKTGTGKVAKQKEHSVLNLNIENETYTLDPQQFLFAKADGNYVSFFLVKDNDLVKELKRTSLKNIEEQITKEHNNLVRTHRAYLVNATHIIKVQGNAQGYQLTFADAHFTVPVSRAMIPAFKVVMNGI